MLASRIDRLPRDEKELLQTLAVIGREFALSLVRRVVGADDDDLNRMLGDLQTAEFIYEQPATGDVEYVFKHALTQEVAYNSLLIERRKLLHERAGLALESMFAGRLDDHLDELAHHYERSANLAKAVDYLGLAAHRTAQRGLLAQGMEQAGRALKALETLPDTHRGLALSRRVSGCEFQLPASEAFRADARTRQIRRILHGRPSRRAQRVDVGRKSDAGLRQITQTRCVHPRRRAGA